MRGLREFFPTFTLRLLGASLGVFVVSNVALAQTAAPGAANPAPGGPPPWMSYVPFIFVIVVMMFITTRQNAKRAKQQQEVIGGLKRGDQVLTNSGILGRVEGIAETFLTLEIADGVRVKILKSQIAGPANLEAKS